MSNSIWRWRLDEFRDRTASNEPTPGGGAVTVVSASLGLSLIIMALEITSRKKSADVHADNLARLLSLARQKLDSLSEHADEDITAFQLYMSALALPKQTEEQKTVRRQALDEALLRATEVPLNAARDMIDALEIAEEASNLSHLNVLSDVGAGAAMLGGAVTGVLYNVVINLPGLHSVDVRQHIAEQHKLLATASEVKISKISEIVSARLKNN